MKAGKDYRVPLSAAILDLLKSLALLRGAGEQIFPGPKRRQPKALIYPLEQMGRGDLTVHGFRSTFRDWAAETTSYPNHVVEQALAHSIGNAVEAAYRRGDLFEKRKALMGDWAAFLGKPPAEIVNLRAGSRKPLRGPKVRPAPHGAAKTADGA